jgi:general secretion pathway protein C
VSIDGLTKRYYPFVLGGLLLAVAYLQGSGISALIGEQLPAPMGPLPPAARSPLATGPRKDPAPILARNPFDSVTGPLRAKSSATAKPSASAAPRVDTDPTGKLPSCAGGSVSVISSADDPAFSFAVIKTTGAAQMRRIGDDIDGKAVSAIEETRVVLGAGSDRCEISIHRIEAGGSSGGAEPPVGVPNAEREPAAPSTRDKSSGDGITKVSDTSYVIEENGAQKLAQMRDAFMRSAKMVDGEGVRLYRSAQTTILGKLGLKKGDIVKNLNGFDMSSIDQSTQAYAALKEAAAVNLTIVRDGAEVKLDYQIKK